MNHPNYDSGLRFWNSILQKMTLNMTTRLCTVEVIKMSTVSTSSEFWVLFWFVSFLFLKWSLFKGSSKWINQAMAPWLPLNIKNLFCSAPPVHHSFATNTVRGKQRERVNIQLRISSNKPFKKRKKLKIRKISKIQNSNNSKFKNSKLNPDNFRRSFL